MDLTIEIMRDDYILSGNVKQNRKGARDGRMGVHSLNKCCPADGRPVCYMICLLHI